MARALKLLPYAVLLLILMIRIWDPALVQQIRSLTFDAYQRELPRSWDPTVPVRIVDIDAASRTRLGPAPWPQKRLAELIANLADAGAAAIVLDDIFSPREAGKSDDAALLAAMASAPVVTGFLLTQGREAGLGATNSDEPPPKPGRQAGFVSLGDDPTHFLPRYRTAIVNPPAFQAVARGNGAFNAIHVYDRVTRQMPLLLQLGDHLYPTVIAEALRVAQGVKGYAVRSSGAVGAEALGERTGIERVKIGRLEIPTDAHGQVLGRFTRHEPQRYIPAWRVLAGEIAEGEIAGRIIFLRTQAARLLDNGATPLEIAIPHVEIRAQIAEQLLAGDHLLRPAIADGVEITAMAVLGLLLIVLLRRFGAVTGLTIAVLGGVATLAVSWFAFADYHWLLDPVAPLVVVFFVFASAQGTSYAGAETAAQRAEEANRAKSDFLAMMSHEVRTPMNGVLGMAQLLQGMKLEAEARDCVEAILGSGRALVRVVDDMLDMARLEADRLTLEAIPFNARDVVAEAARLMTPGAEARGLALVWDVAEDVPPALVGDPFRLRQVLLNLVSNAIKFTDAGTVSLHVENVAKGNRDGAVELAFSVRDTGVGISADTQARLFSPYQQDGADTARRFGGTGLGLAICRRLVRLMDGEIGVESTPGAGSRFHFTAHFPRAAAEAATADEAIRPQAVPDRQLRLLNVEDNAVNRQVANRMLSRAGHEVVDAVDGEAAIACIEAATEAPFDAVLMDRHMPRLDGIAATRRLRASGFAPPILAMTASTSEEDLQLCLDAGMNAVVKKPVRFDHLMAVLAHWTGTGEAPTTPATTAAPRVLNAARLEEVYGAITSEALEIVTLFEETARAALAKYRAAREAGDDAAAMDAAHTLAGASGNAGAEVLSQLFTGIEESLRAGQPPTATDEARIEGAWRDVETALAELRAG